MCTRQEYSVLLRSRRVSKELDRLPDTEHGRVIVALRELSEDPRKRGVVKLQGNIYRFRVGDYRIIYSIDDTARVVLVGAVHRRNEGTYQNVERLF